MTETHKVKMFTKQEIELLSSPLDRRHVKSRSQSGRSLSYIEGWHAIAEANRIFGYDGWDRNVLEYKCVAERNRKIGRDGRDGWSVSYLVHCRVRVGSIIRDGMGAGHGIDVDLGLAHESAIKEAETDAMKRALMTFGNQFGLALYDKDQKNVVDSVEINTEEEPDIHSVLHDMFEFIAAAKTKTALRKYWLETSGLREAYNIVQGTDAYDLLLDMIKNKQESLDG